jgi:mannose-6-phosphate isomerase-like protein (cupin superfamily)
MTYAVLRPDELEWVTRPSEPGEPQRHAASLNDAAGFRHTRANLWRYEPGKGRRHKQALQEETFVVLAGTLSMYVGEPPEHVEVPAGGVILVEAGTALQATNHGETDLLVYAYGYPPESENAELLEPAV